MRELRNVADRSVLGLLGDRMTSPSGDGVPPGTLHEQVEQFERSLISDELRRHHGHIAATARGLGLPKQTLYDKVRRLRITVDEFRTAG